MRYRFGRHVLDLDTLELLEEGTPAKLEPQAFAVLAYLVEHRDRVVRKAELLDEVWGDQFVSESAITTRVKQIRRAIGDDGRAQHAIRTVHGIGYRFVAEVATDAPRDRDADGAGGGSGATPGDASDHVAGTGIAGAARPARPRTDARPLFGRGHDLDALGARLADHRLVTVVGPGGVGKTALVDRYVAAGGDGDDAGAVGSRVEPDRRWICELANTRDADAVPRLVLAAIGETQHSDAEPTETLVRILERRRALVVLDNAEHLVAATAALAVTLLDRCPELRIVATSRVPLGVTGESILPLDPLDADAAVACFVARAADAGATVDPDDGAIAELCERLDRVPLALELAAARSRLLGPRELLDLLGDRFRLLRDTTVGDRRHESLHRTIAWSWDALDPADQRLLAAISVFVGSFSLEDVVGVAYRGGGDRLDAVDALERLTACSLLTPVDTPSGRRRFRLLESVRDFAAAELGDPAAARAQHVRHFTAQAEALDARAQTEHVDDAMAAVRAAWDNLRAAVRYAAADGAPGPVRRIVRSVGPFADVLQAYEILDWCDHAALDDAGAAPPDDAPAGDAAAGDARAGDAAGGDALAVLADAQAVRARMLAHRGDHERARALAAEARARHESHATVLSVVWCAYYEGDLDRVVAETDRLVALSRGARGLERGFAEGFSAIVAAVRQEPVLESTAVTPDDAERGLLGTLDCLAAGLRLCAADPDRAAVLLEAVVERALRDDHRLLLGAAASTLTQLTVPGRPVPEAIRTVQRTLRRYLERSMWILISADTVMAAKLVADHGDPETAARLVGARRASGYRVGLSEVLCDFLEADLERRLGERYPALAEQGAQWRPPDAAEAALAALAGCLERVG